MENRCGFDVFRSAFVTAAVLSLAFRLEAAAESGTLLTGKGAMGDWESDSPGVRRKITVADLPPPSSNALAINRAHVVDRLIAIRRQHLLTNCADQLQGIAARANGHSEAAHNDR